MNHTLLVLQRTLNRGRYNGIDAKITELLKNGITSELSENPNLNVSSYNIEQLLNSNSVSKDNVNQLWNVYLGIIKQSNNFTKKDSQNCEELQTQIDKLQTKIDELKGIEKTNSEYDNEILKLIENFNQKNLNLYTKLKEEFETYIMMQKIIVLKTITSDDIEKDNVNQKIYDYYFKEIKSNPVTNYNKIKIIYYLLISVISIRKKNYLFLAKYTNIYNNINFYITMMFVTKNTDTFNKTFNDEEKKIFKNNIDQYYSKIEKYIKEFEQNRGFIL